MSRKEKHEEEDGERWLLTYADMITLLLALFIVLFAMSSLDARKFEAIKHSLSQQFRGHLLESPGQITPGSSSVMVPNSAADPKSSSFQELMVESQQSVQSAAEAKARQLARTLRASGLRVVDSNQLDRAASKTSKLDQPKSSARQKQSNNDVEITVNERGIIVRLADDAFFDSGSDRVKASALPKLRQLARQLAFQDRDMSIEGHTDGQPISTPVFRDNLELSTARANAVYRLLASVGVSPLHMRSIGYAETRPLVKPPKGNPLASIGRNRRVEIVILAAGAGDSMPGAPAAAAGSSGSSAAGLGPMSVIAPVVSLSEGP